MKIIALDAQTMNPGDLSWDPIGELGELTVYDHTPPERVTERAAEAEILLVNKVQLRREELEALPKLRCICVTATGYNNIDVPAARERGIPVCNAVGYSSDSVAQHVFALLLELTNRVGAHDRSVREGDWEQSLDFSYTLGRIPELAGRTFGIYGFGRIGQRVGELARAFGMEVLATHTHPDRDARPWVRFVSLDELFAASHVISLHAPLREENRGLINADRLAAMKSEAYLINTGRGGLVDEPALAAALETGEIAGAAVDVLSTEPPADGNVLIGAPNCLVTPHVAWATREARERLLEITAENVRAFLEGRPRNLV